MNWIFLLLIVTSVLVGAFTGSMHAVTEAGIEQAKSAVTLSIALVGQMALWLGFFGILTESGVMRSVSHIVRPLMTRLFPDVPADHPAMSAMVMNLSANMLGLANAATPFGLKAMGELNKLNSRPGVATDAMALFLAINNSGVALLQLGVVAVRSIAGSKDPAGILVPCFLGAVLHTTVAIVAAKFFQRRAMYAFEKFPIDLNAVTKGPEAEKLKAAEATAEEKGTSSPRRNAVVVAVLLAFALAMGLHFQRRLHATAAQPVKAEAGQLWATRDLDRPLVVGQTVPALAGGLPVGTATLVELTDSRARFTLDAEAQQREASHVQLPDPTPFLVARSVLSDWILPSLMLIIVLIGFAKGIALYQAFINAAKEGFQIGITIIPYLVAILVSVGMFRASGSLGAIIDVLAPVVSKLGFPAEALPMALIRPLSGNAALGILTDTLKTHGPDSFIGYLVSMLNGSSETTFYVLSLYFGVVGVKAIRHTLLACLLTDLSGVIIGTFMAHLFFG